MDKIKRRNQIGIYYKDYEWGVDQFNFLTQALSDQIVEKIRRNRFFTIVLKSGDIINMYPAGQEMLGHKHTHIYIQKGVEKSIYEVLIAPTLSPFRPEEVPDRFIGVFKGDPVYIIDDFRNMDYIILATDYYYR